MKFSVSVEKVPPYLVPVLHFVCRGLEALLSIDGVPFAGVDDNHRDIVLEPGSTVSVEVEAATWLRAMHEATGKPVIVSEWGATARDSGLPNFWGRLDTQHQRGDAYENVLEQLWDERCIVGSHWFSWGDATEGERRNWGIVDAFDQPYLPLTGAMTRANRRMSERVLTWRP